MKQQAVGRGGGDGPDGEAADAERLHEQRAHDDLATVVEIDAIEAMLGIKCELTSIDGKTIKFDIPPGIDHGQVIRIEGKGMPNPEFTTRGDLMVQVSVSIPQDLTDEDRKRIMDIRHRKSFKA